jgi:hypothetical protein
VDTFAPTGSSRPHAGQSYRHDAVPGGTARKGWAPS